MTNDELFKIAAESGMTAIADPEHVTGICYEIDLITFANAIAQRTREECAAVCLQEAPTLDGSLCAAAIRSMTK